MRSTTARLVVALALCAGLLPAPARSTDVDGPDDCQRPQPPVDFGDAPEGVLAYPGVVGQFPTCLAASTLPGSRTFACPPISTAPGLTGSVRHQHPATDRYWLGCPLGVNPPSGIDGEGDAKMNDNGTAVSACDNTVGIDCTEIVGLLTFGQDECYASSDAALASPPSFKACGPGNVNWTIPAFSCATVSRQAYLNVLADWNQDGDWNDNFLCGAGCAFEWAVKNYPVTLAPGCNTLFVPTFRVGPSAGLGWMRITLSDEQVPDDFPWNGSAGIATQTLNNGETEDYPVVILPSAGPCPDYQDWGDAPEEAQAYPGVVGHFPTCGVAGSPGTQEAACTPPLGSAPGPTGFVKHLSSSSDDVGFWLGCPSATGTLGVDSESDGKTNDTGLPPSACSPNVLVDCLEPSILTFGQDECYGDGADAGVNLPWISLNTCAQGTVEFSTFNCKDAARDVYLNVLVDMNEDGDWNDNFTPCVAGAGCAHEWAVKNQFIVLTPGCQTHTSPSFLVGPNAGRGWVRITLTASPVSDDFPWDGSAGPSGDGFFRGGETEDYLAVIRPDPVGVGNPPRPDRLSLAGPTPNPGRGEVLLRFTLPQDEEVSLAVFDLAGRKLADLARGRLPAGEHRATWNFRDASGHEMGAGYYVVQLRAGNRVLRQSGIRAR